MHAKCGTGTKPHLRTPATDECDFVKQGCLDDLGQRLYHILYVNVADQQPQPKAALQLLDAMVHVLWLQQMEPIHVTGIMLENVLMLMLGCIAKTELMARSCSSHIVCLYAFRAVWLSVLVSLQ